ncbi:MAG: hypothetical protein RL150_578 [Candidatus Parcubacteria bacterium]|jgi:hypothetical protein
MQSIEVYLRKFEHFGLKERELSKSVRQAIEDVCGVTVGEKEISIENGVLRVRVSGSAKAEIFIRRKEIEERFAEILRVL